MSLVPVGVERYTRNLPSWMFYASSAALIAAAAVTLYLMGRPLICTCGYVKLWHGAIDSGNSQHLFDWYSLSHVIHGFILYWALTVVAPNLSFAARLLIALVPEAGWEVAENTNTVIERYREATISLDYYGDSVINSLFDILAMAAGFGLASVAPVRVTVVIAVAFELIALYAIRDNLTLNVVMLVYPSDAIREWQSQVFASPPDG